VQAIGRQLLGARRMEPVQLSLFANAGLVKVNYRAGKNRLTDPLQRIATCLAVRHRVNDRVVGGFIPLEPRSRVTLLASRLLAARFA